MLCNYRLVIKRTNLHVDDTWKTIPKDENYMAKYYRWRVFSFEEAVQNHRESHHPSMYNEPNADLMVHVELNMVAEKQTRTIDDFKNIVMVDHPFDHGTERKIIVLAKGAVSDKVKSSRRTDLTIFIIPGIPPRSPSGRSNALRRT